MIRSFHHKGLQRFWETGDRRGIRPEQTKKLNRMLDSLHAMRTGRDAIMPGYGWHPLKYEGKSLSAMWVTGAWRLIFNFDRTTGDVFDLDYRQYHG